MRETLEMKLLHCISQ